jgi:hypothetical protein
MLYSNVYLCMSPTGNMDQVESGAENFDINFVMKEFPADKQFTIWRIHIQYRDKKQKPKRRVLTEEKLDVIGARP